MIDSAITLVGSLIETPEPRTSTSGLVVTSFRLASTTRRFDRERARWVDGATTFITICCWRQLAENAICSLRRGDRVLVSGRLRQRVYHLEDGTRRATIEIEAEAIGPDLGRHVVQVRRPAREAIPIPGVENRLRRPLPAAAPPLDPARRTTAGAAGMEGIPVPASGVPIPPAPGTGSGRAGATSATASGQADPASNGDDAKRAGGVEPPSAGDPRPGGAGPDPVGTTASSPDPRNGDGTSP